MQIVIYFNEKPVYLCDEITDKLHELMHHPDVVFIDELSTPAINSLLHEIKKDDFHSGILWNKDIDKLKKSFFKHFSIIEAAGGIVQNENKELLFILRKGRWDLPKGKLENREELAFCAEREIAEETGVKNLKLKKAIGTTYHTYDEYGKHFLKISHWFYFNVKGAQSLNPQLEEGITEIKWFHPKNIRTPVANTYPNIKDILTVFFDEP